VETFKDFKKMCFGHFQNLDVHLCSTV